MTQKNKGPSTKRLPRSYARKFYPTPRPIHRAAVNVNVNVKNGRKYAQVQVAGQLLQNAFKFIKISHYEQNDTLFHMYKHHSKQHLICSEFASAHRNNVMSCVPCFILKSHIAFLLHLPSHLNSTCLLWSLLVHCAFCFVCALSCISMPCNATPCLASPCLVIFSYFCEQTLLCIKTYLGPTSSPSLTNTRKRHQPKAVTYLSVK